MVMRLRDGQRPTCEPCTRDTGSHWRAQEITGGHRRSLAGTGDHWRAQEITGDSIRPIKPQVINE